MSLRVSCAWPSSSCSASLTGVAKTLNWCRIFWRVLLSVCFPMGFVDSIVKLGRLRELKFWVRLSLESRLVVGWILGLLQWVAKFVAMVFVFDWRC